MKLFLDEILDVNDLEMSDKMFEEFLAQRQIRINANTAKSYRENLDTLLNEKNMEIIDVKNSGMYITFGEKWRMAA
ncbi:hypothetical protein BTZ13_05015 [Staphylococcus condimenti]|uniref:hypothetical protein n=1 Tax=Staphylococcus TaxID=1279 RepID=UPI0007641F31|nr:MULTISPECIES: hypothetical protein [Staphylococcus]APR60603.1 hypothetical protein BTZ13_05015 [Staphylococcus condimenti]KXA45371.1 hypothetical protein HMPREF3215_01235 [Staphylococcus simulans]MDK8645524.1 hypothetical protein [Staphylococcus condimenti]